MCSIIVLTHYSSKFWILNGSPIVIAAQWPCKLHLWRAFFASTLSMLSYALPENPFSCSSFYLMKPSSFAREMGINLRFQLHTPQVALRSYNTCSVLFLLMFAHVKVIWDTPCIHFLSLHSTLYNNIYTTCRALLVADKILTL